MHLHAILLVAARLAANLVLAAAIFVPLERFCAARRQKILRREIWTDLGYYVLSGVLPNLLLTVPMSLVSACVHHAIPSTFYAHVGQLPLGLRLAAGMVVGEIGYYWGHRWMHEVSFLWRFHAIHHRAEEMDWLINTRAHPLDNAFGRFCGLVPLYLTGLAQPMSNRFDLMPQLFVLIGGLWGYFIHANLNWRFGPLENIVATPAFHHWHHTNDGPDLIDKNYASMLPWVDRLFGTFYLPKHLPTRYGISTPLPATLPGQLIYPLVPPRAPERVLG